jgi:hypothetical protein
MDRAGNGCEVLPMTDELRFHAEQRRELAAALERAREEVRRDLLVGLIVWYSLGFVFGAGFVGAAWLWFSS